VRKWKILRFIWREFGHAWSKKRCLFLCGRVEADSGNKSSTLFLRWHNPAYGLSAYVMRQAKHAKYKGLPQKRTGRREEKEMKTSV